VAEIRPAVAALQVSRFKLATLASIGFAAVVGRPGFRVRGNGRKSASLVERHFSPPFGIRRAGAFLCIKWRRGRNRAMRRVCINLLRLNYFGTIPLKTTSDPSPS